MEMLTAIALSMISVLIASLLLQRTNNKHRRNIRKAKRCIEKLKTIDNNGAVFGYLRKIDPFVFEEIVLCALKEKGHKIKRNKRYTGDGGIDGRATINGDKFFIQAKRYSGHINLKDVKEFSRLCKKQGKKGLFVHTGKTGKASWRAASSSELIDIVSGERLLGLILNQPFTIRRLRAGRNCTRKL